MHYAHYVMSTFAAFHREPPTRTHMHAHTHTHQNKENIWWHNIICFRYA